MVASRSERQSTVCIEQNKLMHESVEHEEENEELIDFEKNDKGFI
jgi:hypothetical protein